MWNVFIKVTFYYIVSEILFKTRTGQSSTRFFLESLAQSQPVMPNVINAWGEILNIGERARSPHSLLRYFMPTFLVVRFLVQNIINVNYF